VSSKLRNGKKIRYTYVSLKTYRWYYWQLEPWERTWHAWENNHPSDKDGFPIDQHELRRINVGNLWDLERRMYMGLSPKVGNPTYGFLRIDDPRIDEVDPYRITMLKPDAEALGLLRDPVEWLALSMRSKRIQRACPNRLAGLIDNAA